MTQLVVTAMMAISASFTHRMYVARDKINFGGNHTNITYTFGCVKKETNLFFRQRADGILGLSPGVK